MLNIQKKMFDEKEREKLKSFQKECAYAHCVLKDSTKYPYIHWLYNKEDEVVGYTIFQLICGKDFREMDDADYIIESVNPEQPYLSVHYLDLFRTKRKKGYGSAFVDWLKKEYNNDEIVAYTTEESYPFWVKNRFSPFFDEDWWLSFSKVKKQDEHFFELYR